MSLKAQLIVDLDTFFNVDEFAEEVTYYLDATPSTVVVQFFDEESGLGDSLLRKCVCKIDAIPNLDKTGYFMINGIKYGVLDFMPDEQQLLMQIVLQKRKG